MDDAMVLYSEKKSEEAIFKCFFKSCYYQKCNNGTNLVTVMKNNYNFMYFAFSFSFLYMHI